MITHELKLPDSTEEDFRMGKYLALASAVSALALTAFANTASTDDRPVKRTVDVIPRLSGPTTSLGKTGVVVKIQSAAIAKDGAITVRATIVDSDGFPLDRLGVATPGPVSMSFIAAYIRPAKPSTCPRKAKIFMQLGSSI